MSDTPKWDDTEEVTAAAPSWDDTEEMTEIKPEEAGSLIETMIKKGAQGASFGMLDELKGGLEAAGSTVGVRGLGGAFEDIRLETDEEDKQSLLDTYRQARDAARNREAELAEANPKTALASEIVGGMATGGGLLKTGTKGAGLAARMGKGAIDGAKMGALSAPGYSEADLTEGDVGGLLKDTAAMSAGGAALGGALPAAGDLVKSTIKGSKNLVKAAKDLPIVGDMLEARAVRKAEGKFIGKEANESIIQESKDMVTKHLEPLMSREKGNASRAIGKIVKRASAKGGKANTETELTKLQKMLDHVKVDTEEGQRTVSELQRMLDTSKNKVKQISIKPKKFVDTPENIALQKLQDKQNRVIAEGDELGQIADFTDPASYDDLGRVTTLDQNTGKVMSSKIPTGTNTPIKYIETTIESFPEQMRSSELHSYVKRAGNIIGGARDPHAKKVATVLKKEIEDLRQISMNSSSEELSNALKEANRRFTNVQELSEILPADLITKRGEQHNKAIDTVAKFLRKAEIDGMSGDDLRDSIKRFNTRLTQIDPVFAKKFMANSEIIAKKYELNQVTGQTFGFNIGTARGAGVRLGSAVGAAEQSASKRMNKAMSKLTEATPQSLTNIASMLEKKGSVFAEAMNQAATNNNMKSKNAMLFGLYQQPAFREEVKDIGLFVLDEDEE